MRTVPRGIFFTQKRVSANAYDDYRVGIEEVIKSNPKTLFGYVDLKKKNRVGYPSIMHFEGRLASGSDDICNLYADDIWVPSDP
jgi:hypothetical protein